MYMCVSQLIKNPPAMQETLLSFLGREDLLEKGEGIGYLLQYSWASLVAWLVKTPPAMRETWVQCLGWEDLWRRKIPLQYSGLENSTDCIALGGLKESDTTEDVIYTGPPTRH